MFQDAELKAFKAELKALLSKYNVSLLVDIEGDTHGIENHFVVSDNAQGGKEFIINHYNNYLSAGDL